MEWVIMWSVICTALNIVSSAVGVAYIHASGRLDDKGMGWVVLGLLMACFDIVIIGGGYIYYLTYILPVVHGR